MRLGRLLIPVLGLSAAMGLAQQALDNDALVRMARAGLSDSLIVTAIHTQPGKYDTSTDGIIALKAAGVSDTVVAAIVTIGVPTPGQAAPAAFSAVPGTVAADSDDPNAPQETGFYIYAPKAQGAKLNWIDPSTYSLRVGDGGILTHPLQADLKGAHADVVVDDLDAVFYLFFKGAETTGRTHARSPFGQLKSPSDMLLLRFDSAGGKRSAVVGKMDALRINYLGHDQSAVVPFTAERVRQGVFKVEPRAALHPGEYAFVPATVMSAPGDAAFNSPDNIAFDFGVQ